MYVVCINYLLRPTEPTCVCEADTALGSVYDTAIALVYLQCVVYVCVCHRSPVQVGVFVCVLYVCLCVYCMCVCAVQIAALHSTQQEAVTHGSSVNFISQQHQSPAHYQQLAQW